MTQNCNTILIFNCTINPTTSGEKIEGEVDIGALFWVDARYVAFPTLRLQDAYNPQVAYSTRDDHARPC